MSLAQSTCVNALEEASSMEQSACSQYMDLRSMETLAGNRSARMGSTTWCFMSGW